MINLLIAIYRANPVRPHCDSKNGIHTFLCKAIMPHLAGGDSCRGYQNVGVAGGDSCRGYQNVGMCGEQPSNSPHWRKVN
jgi:hypothetical protein